MAAERQYEREEGEGFCPLEKRQMGSIGEENREYRSSVQTFCSEKS